MNNVSTEIEEKSQQTEKLNTTFGLMATTISDYVDNDYKEITKRTERLFKGQTTYNNSVKTTDSTSPGEEGKTRNMGEI